MISLELPKYIKMLQWRAYKLNPTIAEDLVQETLLQALKGKFDGNNIKAWLNAILIHTYTNFRRKYNRELIKLQNLELETYTDQMETTSNHLIIAAFAKLPYEFAYPVFRSVIDEVDYAQIAREMGIPEGTVTSRIRRGKEKLKKILQEK